MKYSKRILASILMVVMMAICFAIPTAAHEVYPGYPLRIQDRNSNSGPLLYVHYKYMRDEGAPDNYYNCAIDATYAWDGVANVTVGLCNQISPTKMNISFRCSSQVWSDLALSSSTLGLTWIVDTKGNDLLTNNDFENSSGVIYRALIYMNPTGDIFYTGTSDITTVKNRIQKTMVHEIGHAMGLGHHDRASYDPISSTTYSVMRQGFPDMNRTGIVPQAHERADLYNMY